MLNGQSTESRQRKSSVGNLWTVLAQQKLNEGMKSRKVAIRVQQKNYTLGSGVKLTALGQCGLFGKLTDTDPPPKDNPQVGIELSA